MSDIDFMVTSTWPSNNELRGVEVKGEREREGEGEGEGEMWPRSIQFSANIHSRTAYSISKEVQ